MISITVTIDVNAAQSLMDQVGKGIVPAMAKAINQTVNDVQNELRRRVRTTFTIAPSRLQFIERLIKRTATAKPGSLYGELALAGPLGKSGRNKAELLSRFVFGGTHSKAEPNHPFFIPADVLRPSAYDIPPRNLYPSALRLMNSRGIDGGLLPLLTNSGGQIANTKRVRIAGRKGRGSTELRSFFVAPIGNANGRTPGIYERTRTGPDKGELQLLWLYRPRINLGAPRFPFYATVTDIVHTQFKPRFNDELRALIRAKL